MGVDLLSLAEVLERTGLSRTTLWRYRESGAFPARVVISSNQRCCLWRLDQVDQWIAANPTVRVHRDP